MDAQLDPEEPSQNAQNSGASMWGDIYEYIYTLGAASPRPSRATGPWQPGNRSEVPWSEGLYSGSGARNQPGERDAVRSHGEGSLVAGGFAGGEVASHMFLSWELSCMA